VTTLAEALAHPRSSVRLQAVMTAGTDADAADLDLLVRQCAAEPDFFVRDMLTWALTRLPADLVVPRLLTELRDGGRQARSQALHTLSKVGDRRAWSDVMAHLGDVDDEVAKAAWRAAVALAPDDRRAEVADRLVELLGRGDDSLRRSLSRSVVALGEDVAGPALDRAAQSSRPAVRDHVDEVRRLFRDPHSASDAALAAARREVALGRTRSAKG